MIRETAVKALGEIDEIKPYTFEPPITVRIEYQDALAADRQAERKDRKRIDGRTIEYSAENIITIF